MAAHSHSGGGGGGSGAVISFRSAVLYDVDVAAIEREGAWLTDNGVCFWLEHLEDTLHRRRRRRQASEHGGSSEDVLPVLFMHPATAFMARHTGDAAELAEALAALQLSRRELVLAPVNDNPFTDVAAGGSHWSLLAWRRTGGATDGKPSVPVGFSHWDSAGGRNLPAAREVATALATLLDPALAKADATRPAIASPRCAQQSNGSDCGLFALHFAEFVSEAFLAETESAPVPDDITPRDIAPALRQRMLHFIDAVRRGEATSDAT